MVKINTYSLLKGDSQIKMINDKYRVHGSKRLVKLPKNITLDEKFIEGIGLYIAEGANQSLLALTNTKIEIIKFYIEWLIKYFGVEIKNLKAHIYVNDLEIQNDIKTYISKQTGIDKININVYKDIRAKNPNIKIIYYCSVAKRVLNYILPMIKKLIVTDKKLIASYIRGILCGEAYCLRYTIEISMKNKNEINFISKLLNFLEIKNTIFKRSKREEYIVMIKSRESLEKVKKLDGFKYHPTRKAKLLKILSSYKQFQVCAGERKEFYLNALKELQKKKFYVTTFDISCITKRKLNTAQKNMQELLKDKSLIRFGGYNTCFGRTPYYYQIYNKK